MSRKRLLIAALLGLLLAVAAFGGYQLAPQVVSAAQHQDPLPEATASRTTRPQVENPQAWLGVQVTSLSGGARVELVLKGSPAASAGVERGDVITAVNGNAVANAGELTDRIKALHPKDQVALTVQRNGATQSITITLGTRPAAEQGAPKSAPIPNINPFGGLGGLIPELRDLPPDQQSDHFRGGSLSFTDKNGSPITVNVTPGTVTAVTTDTVTIRAVGANADTSYKVGDQTRLVPGDRGHLGDTVRPQDKVLVVARQDSQEAIAIFDQTAVTANWGLHRGGRQAKPQIPGHFRATPPAPNNSNDNFGRRLNDLRQRLQDLQQRLAPMSRPSA